MSHRIRIPALFVCAAALALLPFVCRAADTAPSADEAEHQAKLDDIRMLMKVTGSDKLGIQVMQQMVPALQKAMPEASQAFWDKFMASVHPEELVELAVPAYDKHMSHDDIKAAIAFYQSEPGKRMVAALPQIMQESMQAGQAWGMKLGMRAQMELQQERDAKTKGKAKDDAKGDKPEKSDQKPNAQSGDSSGAP